MKTTLPHLVRQAVRQQQDLCLQRSPGQGKDTFMHCQWQSIYWLPLTLWRKSSKIESWNMISVHFRWWNKTRSRTPWPCLLPTWSWAGGDYSFFQNVTFDRDEKINSFHCDLLFQTGLSDGRPAWLGSLQLWRTCQVRLLRFLWLYFCLIFAKYLNLFSPTKTPVRTRRLRASMSLSDMNNRK